MLVELAIERIALIESLRITLGKGMTAFTGETGAGKSIVLDAVGLLLGSRASTDFIRTGADSAFVEAQFTLTDPVRDKVLSLCTEWGVQVDHQSLIVSRELHRSGRTVCRLNGRLATVQMLRDLGTLLVQQHGQHDHQGLLRPEEQVRFLDLYGRHANAVTAVKSAFQIWRQAVARLGSAQIDEQERVRRMDMLTFQMEEIERVGLQPEEEVGLRETRKRLLHQDKILQALQEAISCFLYSFSS